MSNYCFLEFSLSESDFCLSRQGQRIALEPKALRVLTLLVSRAGHLVDKRELLESVWPNTFVEENTLTRTIANLRRQLGDSSRVSRLIETVPTRGYRFIAAVEITRTEFSSQVLDRNARKIPVAQNLLPSTIAGRVRADLAPNEQKPTGAESNVKPEAYDSYLRGRFYAQHQNKEDNETAMLAFERAIAIDPTFASAYAELGQTYVWKLFLFAPHERLWREKAFVAIERALSIDPNLAVAYLARGRLLWTPANHFPHVRAIREYRRALALNPNLDEARNQLALIYCHIGYFQEALHESHEATLSNPNNNLAVYRTAQTFAFQGRHEQALVVLRTIPKDANPSLIGYQTAWVLFNLGRSQEASEIIDQLLKDFPEDDGALFISLQAILAAAAGEESVAETRIQLSIKTGKGFGHFHHAAYQIAIAFAIMNRPRQAVEWLEFASIDGFPCYPLFEHDKNLASLRQDPGFLDFMAGLKHRWLGFQNML